MVWSPEQWRQEVEGLVEKCAQKVLAELEEEVLGRLKALSKDIIERICLSDLDIPVEATNQEATKDPIKETIKEPTKETTKEPTKEPGKLNCLWYAFGIVKEEQIVWPLVGGIEDSPCQIIWQESSFNTEKSLPVLVTEGRLGMLVCTVTESEYDEIALHEHLQDLAWVEVRARKHEQVLLEIMEITTIIPLPFGTIFRGKVQIESQLMQHWNYWQLELDRLVGHYEMQLKLLVDPRRMQLFLEETLPYSGNQGGGYFLRRQWEKKLEIEREELIDTYSESLFQDLKSLTVEAMLLVQERTLPSGLKQIFTAQFLLAQQSRQAWEELLHTFDQETDRLGFVLEISGPWPTYHFAGLDKLDELNKEERNSGRN